MNSCSEMSNAGNRPKGSPLSGTSAGLAHEIRTPLAAIEGAADLLRSDHIASPLRQELITILQRESKRLNRLLTELLDYSRPRRSGVPFH